MPYPPYWIELNRAAEELRGIAPEQLMEQIRAAITARTTRHHQLVLERRAALDFGLQHGWQLTPSPFGLLTMARGQKHSGGRGPDEGNGCFRGDIAPCFDHPYWYRRDGKAAAIAAHLYGWPSVQADCQAVAAHYGLTFNLPDFPSWHCPGPRGTTLVAYVGPAGQFSPPWQPPRRNLRTRKTPAAHQDRVKGVQAIQRPPESSWPAP
jgi:hypothetical protein